MSDSGYDPENEIRVRKGSERARRFFSFFGITSARADREESDE